MYKVKSITTISWLIVTASLLGACAGKPTTYTTRPAVNPASTVQIKANLDIPDQRARVFMQNGTVLAEKAINRWDAYCSVLVRDVQYSDQPQQTVQPGHFDILKVRESNDYTTASKTYVASNSIFLELPSFVLYRVDMHLVSAEQPDVLSLSCEKRGDNGFRSDYPTLLEMRVALGDLIDINEPG